MRLRITLLALAPLAVAQASEAPVFAAAPLLRAQPTWWWVIGTAVVALVVGFVLGWRALDRRIRRKFGGLRIH